jgi:small subunit ribosomal protein S5
MARVQQDSGLLEEVIGIYFHTKVTKGGRNLSVAALVAVGDGRGNVGLGYGKASGVPMAIEKAGIEARASMVNINMIGDTIAHEITGRHGAARVLLIPATPGTGVKAGGTVRSILMVAGIHNVLSKVHGNTNPINVAKATMDALTGLMSLGDVKQLRGVAVRLFHPQADQDGQPITAARPKATGAATAVAEAPVEKAAEPEAEDAAEPEAQAEPAGEPEAEAAQAEDQAKDTTED